jgi:hypothetical protein
MIDVCLVGVGGEVKQRVNNVVVLYAQRALLLKTYGTSTYSRRRTLLYQIPLMPPSFLSTLFGESFFPFPPRDGGEYYYSLPVRATAKTTPRYVSRSRP